jgi:hypothetical protein
VRFQISVLLLLGVAGILSATPITYNPAPTTSTGWNACTNYPGFSCETTAYFDAQSLGDQNDSQNINGLFDQAFTAWNDSGGGQGWTLNFMGDLTGTLDVTVATAQQFGPVVSGGLTITIDPSDITLPALGAGQSLVWSQGLYDNYLNGNVVPPFYEMDIISGACNTNGTNPWCPPAYPYTYPAGNGAGLPTNAFYDQPKATYMPPGTTQKFLEASVYLSVIDYTTKTLNVYDGVSYGFQNFVSPEPGVWFSCGGGLLALCLLRRKCSV